MFFTWKAIMVNLLKQSKWKTKDSLSPYSQVRCFYCRLMPPRIEIIIFYKPLVWNFETFEAQQHHAIVCKSFKAAKAGTYEIMGGECSAHRGPVINNHSEHLLPLKAFTAFSRLGLQVLLLRHFIYMKTFI